MDPDVVWIEEQEQVEGQAGTRLLGRFSARHEQTPPQGRRVQVARLGDVDVDEAIAWGRERAGLVLVRFGRRAGYWSAGRTPHWGYPGWPPPDLPPLTPRLVVGEDWKARPTAEPLYWAVTFWLTPKDLGRHTVHELRERCDVSVAVSASTALLGWDARCLEGFLADELRSRAERNDGSVMTSWPPAYRVYAIELAKQAASAKRQALKRYTAPQGFAVRTTVRPADRDEESTIE